MALTDPIADYLTRIRNAQLAGHKIVEIPSSKMKKSITEILYDQGFIHRYKFVDAEKGRGVIMIALKYNQSNKQPVIKGLGRISKPGLRKYSRANDIPRVNSGLGLAIVSTSTGLMTDKQARTKNVGGELICYVF